MTIRKRHPPTEPATVWPRRDRCNRPTKPEWLTSDGLGLVCPPCRVGGAAVTGEGIAMKLIGWLLAALLAAGFWTWVGVATVWGLVRKGRRL